MDKDGPRRFCIRVCVGTIWRKNWCQISFNEYAGRKQTTDIWACSKLLWNRDNSLRHLPVLSDKPSHLPERSNNHFTDTGACYDDIDTTYVDGCYSCYSNYIAWLDPMLSANKQTTEYCRKTILILYLEDVNFISTLTLCLTLTLRLAG
jgi:hypothetical protein